MEKNKQRFRMEHPDVSKRRKQGFQSLLGDFTHTKEDENSTFVSKILST
ncbi:unnamed protein product [Brassica oleracea]